MPDRARFEDFAPFRAHPAFEVRGAYDRKLERRVLIVSAALESRSECTREALARLHRAHHRPVHFAIAPAIEWLETTAGPWVIFDAPASCDLGDLVERATTLGVRATLSEADAFVIALRDAFVTRAAMMNAEGRPVDALRHLSYGNVLCGPGGWFGLLGFGHNVVLHDAGGSPNTDMRWFAAPEVARGEEGSLVGDVVAVLRMCESLVAQVELDPALERCRSGQPRDEDRELRDQLRWIERFVTETRPSERAPMQAATQVCDRLRELLGIWPDLAALRMRVDRLVGGRTVLEPPAPAALEIARDGTWFRRAGEAPVNLATRRVLSRLLAVLVEARRDAPGVAVPADTLMRAAWPSERRYSATARNRLYVSINALRGLGLAGDLQRVDAGYLLAPSITISFSETGVAY